MGKFRTCTASGSNGDETHPTGLPLPYRTPLLLHRGVYTSFATPGTLDVQRPLDRTSLLDARPDDYLQISVLSPILPT